LKDLWVPLSAAIARQRQVETIANNVANANTPGFKKDQLTFKEYVVNLDKGGNDIDLPNKTWKPEDFYRTSNNEDSFVKIDGSFTNFEQGDLIPTKNNLDIALRGNGFIEILTPQGLRYTRKGALSISNEGRLITDQGYPVVKSRIDLGQKPEFIQLPERKVSINQEGQIFTDQGIVDRLSIVEFLDPQALKKEGNSMFINPDIKNVKADSPKTIVLQGFLEQSNVNAIQEMAELIKASRNFDSVQNVIKTYDSMANKANTTLLRF
jgi:flagellar basal-body rod protein FlgG